ncbi:phosphatases II [Aureobasidium pullulans]|uniref:protein-tyrosine-phosphatase n=1 Tax=Aureobasidium pullulans TaxID=5580 RepID=A0AB38M4F2_AURPU|nr:phosphatases II [Aureobasidium pullulans]THZ42442.1 phosphatases II [Aureobasidium pullulans]THZ99973.1 phosphatases II [Aureobasidium pullulans]
MPQSDSPSAATSYGQVIEYIQDRLYLASYTHKPNAQTPFPYTNKSSSKSPSKRSARSQSTTTTTPSLPPVYFSVDKHLLYNAFHADFGPLHIGHLYRFAVMLHEVLGDPENEGRPVVFWCNADSRSRANAACILACYMILIQNWPPHLALAPIAQMDPPCMPFRDAGYSQADYGLTVQDVVYGVWKAKEEGLCGLKDFSLEEYEKYERVDMGDFNWISPSFLAFASPQHQPTHVITPTDSQWATLPRSLSALHRSTSVPQPFKNVLSHFVERGIGLVVRLNSELYSPSYFQALGIKHLDMIFDDGTCPPLSLVRKFVNLAHEMITVKRKGIAVHCKAGLGRTGCLIGAYLIYKHGFTANEIIAYMRFMRPGMVVGPQQHWLHLNQGTFREWWFEDTMREKIAASIVPATPTKATSGNSRRLASNGQTFTPPNGSTKRAALVEISHINEQEPATFASSTTSKYAVNDENLPAPTPGQPRKTSKVYGHVTGRKVTRTENEPFEIRPDTEIVSMQRTSLGESESEEEQALRALTSSRKASQSPVSRSGKRRAVSCTTTTTTTTKWGMEESDVENRLTEIHEDSASPRKPKTPSTRSGKGDLSIGKRSSPSRRSTEGKTSVRKTSGRVGSVGANVPRTRAS